MVGYIQRRGRFFTVWICVDGSEMRKRLVCAGWDGRI